MRLSRSWRQLWLPRKILLRIWIVSAWLSSTNAFAESFHLSKRTQTSPSWRIRSINLSSMMKTAAIRTEQDTSQKRSTSLSMNLSATSWYARWTRSIAMSLTSANISSFRTRSWSSRARCRTIKIQPRPRWWTRATRFSSAKPIVAGSYAFQTTLLSRIVLEPTLTPLLNSSLNTKWISSCSASAHREMRSELQSNLYNGSSN